MVFELSILGKVLDVNFLEKQEKKINKTKRENWVLTKDENIGNHGYIGDISADILKKKISISLKLIKIYKNIRKNS